MNSATRTMAVILLTAVAWPLPAQATALHVVEVDSSGGGSEVDGFVTQDLLLDFNGAYTGTQLTVGLSKGSIYQHPLGRKVPPTISDISLHPAIAFDSFAAMGSPTADGPFGLPFLIGSAVNIDFFSERSCLWTDLEIDCAWASPPGNAPVDQSDFLTARVTLSKEAAGILTLFASVQGTFFDRYLPIVDGRILLTPQLLPGDYDANGRVEQADLDLVLLHWGDELDEYTQLDAGWYGNPPLGPVDQEELDRVLLAWENSLASASSLAAVPEPSALILALVAACFAWSAHVDPRVSPGFGPCRMQRAMISLSAKIGPELPTCSSVDCHRDRETRYVQL